MATVSKATHRETSEGRRFRPTGPTSAPAASAQSIQATQATVQIVRDYDPSDKRLFHVVRRPASAWEAAWPSEASEPMAHISVFRAWLRSLPASAVVGVAANIERDPIATWLRETRGYAHVRVRAGQPGCAGEGTARVRGRRGRPTSSPTTPATASLAWATSTWA
jgi:hypothetical protein